MENIEDQHNSKAAAQEALSHLQGKSCQKTEFINLLVDLLENLIEIASECPDHINVKSVVPLL
jgi:hypothetical protein